METKLLKGLFCYFKMREKSERKQHIMGLPMSAVITYMVTTTCNTFIKGKKKITISIYTQTVVVVSWTPASLTTCDVF